MDLSQLPLFLDKNQIQELLPQKGIALFLDRCEIRQGKNDGEIVALGSFTFPANHPLVTDHFGVVRAVDLLEVCGQTGTAILSLSPQFAGMKGMFTGFDKTSIRRNVLPGQEIKTEVVINPNTVRCFRGTYHGEAVATATVEGNLVVKGVMSFAIAKLDDMPKNDV